MPRLFLWRVVGWRCGLGSCPHGESLSVPSGPGPAVVHASSCRVASAPEALPYRPAAFGVGMSFTGCPALQHVLSRSSVARSIAVIAAAWNTKETREGLATIDANDWPVGMSPRSADVLRLCQSITPLFRWMRSARNRHSLHDAAHGIKRHEGMVSLCLNAAEP